MPRLRSRRRGGEDLGEEGAAAAPDASSDSDAGVSDASFSESEDSAAASEIAPSDAMAGDVAHAGAGERGSGPAAAFIFTFEPDNFELPRKQPGAAPAVFLASLALPDPAVPVFEAWVRVCAASPGALAVRGSDAGWADGSVVEWAGSRAHGREHEVPGTGGEIWLVNVDLGGRAGWDEAGDGGDEARKVFEFAVRFTADGGVEEWDSNGGANYCVVLLRRKAADIAPDSAMVPPDERIVNWADERVPTPPSVPEPPRATVQTGFRGRGAPPARRGPVPSRPSKTMLAAQRAGIPDARVANAPDSAAPGEVQILPRSGPVASAEKQLPPPGQKFWGHDDRFASPNQMGSSGRGRGSARPPRGGTVGSTGGRTASRERIEPGGVSRGGRGDDRGGRAGKAAYRTWDPADDKLLKERWPHDGFEELNNDSGRTGAGRRRPFVDRGRGRAARGRGMQTPPTATPISASSAAAPAPAPPVTAVPAPTRSGPTPAVADRASAPSSAPSAISSPATNISRDDLPAKSDKSEVAVTGAEEDDYEVVVDYGDLVAMTSPSAPAQTATRAMAGVRRDTRPGLGIDSGGKSSESSRKVATALKTVKSEVENTPTADTQSPASTAQSASRTGGRSRPHIIPQGHSMFQALAAAAQSRGLERQVKEDKLKKRAQERETRAKQELLSAIEAPEFTPTVSTPATRPSDSARANQEDVPAKTSQSLPSRPTTEVTGAAMLADQEALPATSLPTSSFHQRGGTSRGAKPFGVAGRPPRASTPVQNQLVGTMAPYSVPVAQIPAQPNFYTANGMVVQPMLTTTGQMVFITENGLMVPSEGMYASSFSPPAMPIDYSGYALGGAPTPETGYGGGYYGAAMPFAGQDPSVPIPIALPRTSRPVTLKSPTGDDRR